RGRIVNDRIPPGRQPGVGSLLLRRRDRGQCDAHPASPSPGGGRGWRARSGATGRRHGRPLVPPIDYFGRVFLPLIRRLGAHVDVEVLRRGYYPRGGGIVEV